MDSIFYIKGVRPNGDIAIFNGYQNPYDISLDNPPKGFGYNNKNDAIDNKDCIKNPFVKIDFLTILSPDTDNKISDFYIVNTSLSGK